MAEKCATCLFRPGNRMRLEPGRLAEIVEHNRSVGAALICHHTLSYGDHPEMGETVCRGFYDAYRDEVAVIQIVERLGGFVLVDPPEVTLPD
jgi:hypothetical protein